MNIELNLVDGLPVVGITGEVDLHTQRQLRDSLEPLLANPRQHRIALDLSRVNFMDSSAASYLWESQRRLARAGRQLVVTGASRPVKRLCRILDAAGMQFSA